MSDAISKGVNRVYVFTIHTHGTDGQCYSFKNISYGKQFKLADQSGARLALIYGAEEVTENRVKIRDLSTGAESEIPDNKLELALKKYFEN